MPAIITNDLRITNGDYFQNDVTNIPMYIYFGGTSPWNDEQNPPDAVDSTQGRIAAVSDVIGLKRIFSSNVVSVLPRNDWSSDTVYDEYTDKANILDDKNPVTNDYYRFYVFTDEFNVYKCISNNNRAESTVKPTGTGVSSFQTPDGYIWKYMYSVRSEDAFKFMTPNWIPCYTVLNNDGSQQWQIQQAAVPGSIEHITVASGGSGYVSTNPPNVVISGSGSGATAVAEVNDTTGAVERIIVTNIGQNYYDASVSITGGDGGGALAEPVLSPIDGHGADARRELGATYKMIRVEVESDEGGVLPVGVDYRKAGILLEPRSNDSGVSLYINSTKLYSIGDTVVGDPSGASGTVRSINSLKNQIYLEDVSGTFTINETVSSTTYNSTQLLSIENESNLPLADLVVNGADYSALTGTPIYFSNREKITRGVNQIEAFAFIISF